MEVGTGSVNARTQWNGEYYDFNDFDFGTVSPGDKVDFKRTVTETQHPFRLCSAENCPAGTQLGDSWQTLLGDSDLTYVDDCVTVTLTTETWYICTVHGQMVKRIIPLEQAA